MDAKSNVSDSPDTSVIVHETPERLGVGHDPSFEGEDIDLSPTPSSSFRSSPVEPRGRGGPRASDVGLADTSIDSSQQSTPALSRGDTASSSEHSLEIIIDSKSPDWFVHKSVASTQHAQAYSGERQEMDDAATSPDSSFDASMSPPSKAVQRPRALSVAEVRSVAPSSPSPSGKATTGGVGLPLDFDHRRRASHDGNQHSRKKSSISPMLDAIPDDRTSEAVAMAILDPAASTFEPAPLSEPLESFESDASIEFILEHGQNGFGYLTKAARKALTSRGLAPIPAMHGPLSLPYARCPSGIDAFLFSVDKEEDPWTFTFEHENGLGRRGGPRQGGATRYAQVPLPGNARYSQSIHPLHARLSSRIVSAPAELDPVYNEPQDQEMLEVVPSRRLHSDAPLGNKAQGSGPDTQAKTLEFRQAAQMEAEALEREILRATGFFGRAGADRPSRLDTLGSTRSRMSNGAMSRSVAPTQSPAQNGASFAFSGGQAVLPQSAPLCGQAKYDSQARMKSQTFAYPNGGRSSSSAWPVNPSNAVTSHVWQPGMASYLGPYDMTLSTAHLSLPPLLSPPTSLASAMGGSMPHPLASTPSLSAVSRTSDVFQDPAIVAACIGMMGTTWPYQMEHGMSSHPANDLASAAPRGELHPISSSLLWASQPQPLSSQSVEQVEDPSVAHGGGEGQRKSNAGYTSPSLTPTAPRRPSIPLPIAPVRSLVAERRNSAAPFVPQVGARKSSLAPEPASMPRRSSVAPQIRLVKDSTAPSSAPPSTLSEALGASRILSDASSRHSHPSSSSASSRTTPRPENAQVRAHRRHAKGEGANGSSSSSSSWSSTTGELTNAGDRMHWRKGRSAVPSGDQLHTSLLTTTLAPTLQKDQSEEHAFSLLGMRGPDKEVEVEPRPKRRSGRRGRSRRNGGADGGSGGGAEAPSAGCA